jgi:hypothetical protein
MAGFVGFHGSELSAGATTIGEGTKFDQIRKVSQAVDLPSINAGASSDVAVVIADVDANDIVALVEAPTLNAGLAIQSVDATATGATVRVTNATAGAIDAASMTMVFLVIRVA